MAEQRPPGTASTFSTRWILGIAALVAISLVGAVAFLTSPFAGTGADRPATPAPTTPATAYAVPDAPVTGGVGKPVEWYQHTGRGTVTVHDASWETRGTVPPADGLRYLVLDVEVACTEGTLAVNPLYLSAEDSRGNEAFLAQMSGYQPELPEVVLEPGKAVRAKATFEVAPGETTVIFTEELFNPILQITVDGPR